MHFRLPLCAVALATAAITLSTPLPALAQPFPDTRQPTVQLGPRPYFLVNEMSEGQLKQSLQACTNNRAIRSDFSIGHRGAGMQFPEHTRESYEAAARMGAGIIECDVTFTKDKELVCRHSQSDLHTTTNILVTPLATKCTKPFTPATYDPTGKLLTNASAECRTSDITLAEFRTLRGKMDASNPQARTAAEYQGGTASVRTDLYAGPSSGTLMTHKESIELFKRLGVKMTPELKNASVTMPFDGFTQQAYAQKMIDEYKQMGVPGWQVFAQSFDINDVLYWVSHEPEFGPSAVYLDSASTMATVPTAGQLAQLRAEYRAHLQARIAGGDPGAQRECFTAGGRQQIVVRAAPDRHGAVQALVVRQAQTQRVGMGPADLFAPLHVHRVVGVVQATDNDILIPTLPKSPIFCSVNAFHLHRWLRSKKV